MKNTLLLAALAALCPFAEPVSANQDVSNLQEKSPAHDGSLDLPGMLTPGVLSALSAELLLDEPGDGRTWARGPQWKASFGPEGFTYIPFFGSDAPQNYPVEFDLKGATVGGESIELLARERGRDGQTVWLDRGTVDEVYHLTKETVEQTFVFETLASRGELVLDIAVKTELSMTPSPAGGFAFFNDLGEVHYSRAIAIDAQGSTLEVQQEMTPSGLRIVVPEEFISTAVLPLVVDPILSTFSVATNSRRQLEVDVAYEGNNTTYQIVYSELQSTFDSDVIAVSYNAPLGLLLPATSLDITSASWGMPQNASCYHEEQFLCVSVVGFNIGSKSVWGRTRHAGTGVRGPQFQISGVGVLSADVGGKGNEVLSSYDYMVVWQESDGINQDMDIVAQAVRGDSTLTLGRIIIDGDIGDYDRVPAISKSSGRPGTSNSDNEYMIVWERTISPTDRNIRAQVIEYTGSRTGHSQFNAYTFSDSLDPDVSTVSRSVSYGGVPYWVVVFERLIGSDHDIFTVVARDGDADNARNIHTMQNLDLNLDHRDPIIAFDSEDYLICYQSEAANGDRSVHFTAANVVHDDGELRTGLTLRRETLALSEGAPATIGLASHWDGGGPFGGLEPGDALVSWTFRDDASNDTDVAGALIAEVEGGSIGSQYCAATVNSTGTSAWIVARGFSWNPAISLNLECNEMPLNTFGHYIVSNQAGFIPFPSGSQGHLCVQGAIGRFNRTGEILNSGATGSFTLSGVDAELLPSPSGPVSAMAGETWNFQCWFRDNGPNSNFSNAVGVTFD